MLQIGVHQHQIVTGRFPQSGEHRGFFSEVSRKGKISYLCLLVRVRFRQLPQPFQRTVPAAVIDKEDLIADCVFLFQFFQRRRSLRVKRFYAGFFVIARHDDADLVCFVCFSFFSHFLFPALHVSVFPFLPHAPFMRLSARKCCICRLRNSR